MFKNINLHMINDLCLWEISNNIFVFLFITKVWFVEREQINK